MEKIKKPLTDSEAAAVNKMQNHLMMSAFWGVVSSLIIFYIFFDIKKYETEIEKNIYCTVMCIFDLIWFFVGASKKPEKSEEDEMNEEIEQEMGYASHVPEDTELKKIVKQHKGPLVFGYSVLTVLAWVLVRFLVLK